VGDDRSSPGLGAHRSHSAFLRSLPWSREILADTSLIEETIASSVIGKIEFSSEEQTVLEALAGLPHRQRDAMAWHFDGFTPAEIAEMLGTNSAAVRLSLARARRNLARRLDMAERHAG
jgi:DNA-directed RNA polymerase specialized sigma24 family protein